MRHLALLSGILLVAVGCQTEKPTVSIRATLEANPNRTGWFVMHISNASAEPVKFLDIREGTGWCGEFYEITVEKGGRIYESKGNCLYAPASIPKIVEILPGETYDREIQPGAYVKSEKHLIPPYDFTVRYRLTEKIKEYWRSKPEKVDLGLTFQTEKMRM